MARSPRQQGPTPVEVTTHSAKRTNIPTADAQDLVDEALMEPRRVRMERRLPTPELLWRGKDDDDLDVEAPPIFIQEKVAPRALVENLRKTAAAGEAEPELTLFDSFDSFDGLDDLDAVDYYRHEANWSNRMVLGDSLQVMASLAEREQLRGQVQMIYIDPPYGIKFGSNWQASARKRDVKDGKLEDAAREAEQIKAFRDTWELGIHSYLSYLRDRLLVARDLLTESGSCFVQIGDENVHLVRSLMEEVFGAENFVSQISVDKTSSSSMGFIDSVADYVIWFGKNLDRTKYRPLFAVKAESTARFLQLPDGSRRAASKGERDGDIEVPRGSRWYDVGDLTSQTDSSQARYTVEFDGERFAVGTRNWATPLPGMTRAMRADRVARRGASIGFIRFADDFPVVPLRNNWTDTGTGSFTDPKIYVVQTGNKIVERCVLMATDPGDLILDPTCGSGTTAFVAEQWGRRWITIDTSRVALALARQRLMGAKYPYYLLADSDAGRAKEGSLSATPLPPAAVTNDIRHGFVYERVQHVTLKSIANNPDIVEGMSRAAIDAAIKRHADFEKLYDKPYEDKKTVRVTGPFTVESLSPHRALGGVDVTHQHETQQQAAGAAEGTSFEQTILDNLGAAGIQNGTKGERIEFAGLDQYAGAFIQAVGERRGSSEDDAPGRVAIALGPQYGTVSPDFIKGAAKEAIRDADIDLLCVLGFSFDAQATEVKEVDGIDLEPGFAAVAAERRVGRLPVLFVRMNVDLLMGEDLKKTGAGNLFTVFGEPDIEVRDDGDHLVVELRGVDVYDPTQGTVRSDGTDRIALWMIDTDYDEESFFVRHCYFTGGNDPYKRLKTALKADIDADAWETLYSTVSRPFDRPSTGLIAIKVINDFGDEVMKVYEID